MVPFLGIVGNERIKIALQLLCIDPKIGSLLILGRRGSGKTRLAASIESLGETVLRCPAGISEEQLFSQLDLEKTLASGHVETECGLLERAAGSVLMIDEVGRMNRKTLQMIAENVPVSGPLSPATSALRDYRIVATMNPEEAQDAAAVVDQFDLVASTEYFEDVEEHCCIIEAELQFQEDPVGEARRYESEHEALREHLARARRRVGSVYLPFPLKVRIVRELEALGIAGNRFEGVLYRVACAHAALREREVAYDEDVTVAVELVLRLRSLFSPPASQQDYGSTQEPPSPETPPLSSDSSEENREDGSDRGEEESHPQPHGQNAASELQNVGQDRSEQEDVFAVGDAILPQFEELRAHRKTDFLGVGRKEKALTRESTGRKVRTESTEEYRDIDLFGTLIQAAPHQRYRRASTEDPLVLLHSDLRRKVRERGVGHHVVILIDSSGSLAVNRRMQVVKGAVFELLKRSYVRRDHVALLSFRRDRAEILLPLTRSLTLAKKRLEHLPTGGNTPLGLGIERLADYVMAAKVKQPEALFRLFIISDGRANRAMGGGSPIDEAKYQARRLRMPGVQTHVLDYERARFPLGLMRELAEIAQGSYTKMDELTESEMIAAMR